MCVINGAIAQFWQIFGKALDKTTQFCQKLGENLSVVLNQEKFVGDVNPLYHVQHSLMVHKSGRYFSYISSY